VSHRVRAGLALAIVALAVLFAANPLPAWITA
jgi:hypothetical protein